MKVNGKASPGKKGQKLGKLKLKPKTPQELSKLMKRGRVSKRQAPFCKGFIVTDLAENKKPRLRQVKPTKNSKNGTSSRAAKSKNGKESTDSDETASGSDKEEESNEQEEEDSEEKELSAEESSDKEEPEDEKEDSCSELESDQADEMNTSQFESFDKSSTDPVAFRQVEAKVFQAEFRKNCRLNFQGKLVVTLLQGKVQVMGWPLTVGKTETIFSTRGASLVGLQGQKGALLELRRQDTNLDSCLQKLHPIGLLSGVKEKAGGQQPATTAKVLAERSLDCKFYNENSGEKVIVLDQRWEGYVDQLVFSAKFKAFRTVFCGGKGLGKSTLMRLLINTILSQQEGDEKKVLVLDLDPGQSEFTAPGCLSVVEVTEPLLGPNFTHLKTPLRSMYLGQVDVSRCLKEYQSAAQDLILYCSSIDSVPLLVNTMGFNSGVGVKIMRNVAERLLDLGELNLIEMRSFSMRRNYPDGTFELGPNCRVVQLQSVAEKANQTSVQAQWGMPPNVQREISVLSYLSPILHPPHYSCLPEPPHVIRLGYLVVGVATEYVHPKLVLRALVGNMVALCKIDNNHPKIKRLHNGNSLTTPGVINKPPSLPCFGYGIVAGIDLPAGQLYIQTPESKERLHNVNCLLMGSVQMPQVLRIAGARGCVPFISTGELPATSAPVREVYRPISSLVEKRS